MNDLSLRPVSDEDLPLLTIWLNKDHVQKWFHDPGDWLKELEGRQGAFSWVHHFMIMKGAEPIGFCQYYDCCDANEMEDWYEVRERGQTFSIDYMIGEEACLGRGYGKKAVSLLTGMIRDREKAARVIVQPDRDNHASNRALAANGYIYDDQGGYFYKLLNNRKS